MTAKRVDLVIVQGDTFERMVRWETKPFLWIPITGIEKVAPVRIHAPAHGLTDGWRVAVVSVQGMLQINAVDNGTRDSDFKPCTYDDADHIFLNEVDASNYDAWTAGGYLKFYTPVDLSGYAGKIEIRDRIGGTILDTIDTGITISSPTQTIQVVIARDVTAAFTWRKAVYDLQMINSNGDTETTILTGTVTLTNEVTV